MYRVVKKFAWSKRHVHEHLSANTSRDVEIQFEFYYEIQMKVFGKWINYVWDTKYKQEDEAYKIINHLIKSKN